MPATNLYGNFVLDARSKSDRERMAPGMHVRAMERREPTHQRGERLQHVDFPIDAVMSVVATFANGDVCEVGTVGRESFVEADGALDSDVARRNVFCQVAGSVVRMPLSAFEQELRVNVPFARSIRRNVSARLFTSEQFAACNLKHPLIERCARWLLMTRDRVGRDEFPLTHDLLSIMLGVRRAGVSAAAAALQATGAISYRRGVVVVHDNALLTRAACECYQHTKDAFEQSLLLRNGD
jgi:CRP-like cAMP-binding protein